MERPTKALRTLPCVGPLTPAKESAMPEAEILETLPGDYLPTVIRTALARANERGGPVRFTFNEATVDVLPGQSAAAIESAIHAKWEAEAEAHRASPAGQKAAADAAVRVAELQKAHDGLMAELPAAFTSDASTIDWLERYSDPGDDTRVTGRDFGRVADALERAGYRAGAACGLEKYAYEDPRILARWLIGQALDQLRSGMPPHPGMMGNFASEYRKLG